MNKFVDYIKKNYLFVGIILVVIILLTVLVVIRLNKKTDVDWTPIEGEIPYEIKKHEANEYKIIKIEDEDIAVAYYRNWIYLVVNNPEEAYKMLGSKSKKEFDTYEKFTKWIEQYKTVKTKDNTVTGYSYKKSGGYNTIIVRSSENMRYRFTENSVWNYKVDILGQERVTDTTKLVTKKR
jgi:hypothetical protein